MSSLAITSGCFDVLHPGHLKILNAAKDEATMLTVLLNSDDSIRRLKGPTRPINLFEARKEMLLNIKAVNRVVWFDENDPADALRQQLLIWAGEYPVYRSNFIYFKGSDWMDKDFPELPIVHQFGGKVRFIDRSSCSTTQTLERVLKLHTQAPEVCVKCGVAHGSEAMPIILFCPKCGNHHVDKNEFATKLHHTHACQFCPLVWRPAVFCTVGVAHLPGFRDERNS
jgi:rfaE bifunctional protein nucleotidyltransferase chain/domain